MEMKARTGWILFFLSAACLVTIGIVHLANLLFENAEDWDWESLDEGIGNDNEYDNEYEYKNSRAPCIMIDGKRWIIIPPPESEPDPDFDLRFAPDYDEREDVPGFTRLSNEG